jgi:hypothetical protein
MNIDQNTEIRSGPKVNDTAIGNPQLFNVIPINSSKAVLKEVVIILKLISSDFDIYPVRSVFHAVIDLFNGNWPGYRACNTEYHDLYHTTDTFLATARLIHGAVIDGKTFTNRDIALGLISILLHDVGYIQEEHDTEGTGAKYTTSHVQRSIEFVERHGSELGLADKEIAACGTMILCTDLSVDISDISFSSAEVELLGKIVASADLLAQMADRTYLEKLLFLYYELAEAGIQDFTSELDLLKKTVGFYDYTAQRLETTLGATDKHMSSHFLVRWGIQEDLYHTAIEKQRDYLKKILKIPNSDPRDHLKREGIVKKIQKDYREKMI